MFDVFDSTQDEDNQGIIPLEVGVAIYSITKGITRTYQRFIKPQSIPTGYRYDAIRHSMPVKLFVLSVLLAGFRTYPIFLSN